MYSRRYELRIGQNFGSAAAEEITEITPEQQRAAINEFFSAGETYTNAISSTIDPDVLMDAVEKFGDNRIYINQNQLKFEIEKTGGDASEGNSGEIVIYNLADESAKLLQRLSGVKNFVELLAGYEDETIKTVFRGNLTDVEDAFDGMDRRTKLKVSDGGAFVQSQLTARKYAKGTAVDTIVDDLLQDLALPRGVIYKLGDDVTIKSNLVVHGPAAGELKRILSAFHYSMNIQDLFVNVVSNKSTIPSGNSAADLSTTIQTPLIETVINVTPDSGLISSPTYIGDYSDLSESEALTQSTSGIKFRSLLNGEFQPNLIIQVVSSRISGVYRILKVTHRGSFRGDEWYSDVEAEEVYMESGVAGVTTVQEDPAETTSRIYFGNNVLPGEL